MQMDSINITKEIPAKDLVDAQAHIYNHIFSFLNSMALKCAIELGIPDAIQKHGKPITLCELANSLSLHPNKALSLPRLMRLLVHSNFFSKQTLSSGEETFDLTINSQLLLKDNPLSLAPFASFVLNPSAVKPSYHFSSWFQKEGEKSPFHIAHNNKSIWEYAADFPQFNKLFNEGMASDARFEAALLVANDEFKGLIKGIESLVDVGGGNGTMAIALAKAFPGLMCVVFDLPHVVKGLEGCEKNLKFVGGDMFEAIPSAQAVLLKSILHDWGDDQCIKILQRCREAIPDKNGGGKIIIIDMVVETNNDLTEYSYTKFLFDIEMMNVTIGGKERTQEEWKSIFISAGFNDYEILPIQGAKSVIKVYP